MKTSTKLLVIFFLVVFGALVWVNWLLAKNASQGQIRHVNNGIHVEFGKERTLDAFHHVVVDGRVHTSKGCADLRAHSFMTISSTTKKATLAVCKGFESMV